MAADVLKSQLGVVSSALEYDTRAVYRQGKRFESIYSVICSPHSILYSV